MRGFFLFLETQTSGMYQATIVTTQDELLQIHRLNKLNYKHQLSAEEKDREGFVSWLYPIELLEKMQELAPNVIVKDGDKVVGYALVAFREAAPFHPDLQTMFTHLDQLIYKGQSLADLSFYVMGQVCIDQAYRGKGIFHQLYQHHKELYSPRFDLLITEISTSNIRSQRAHEKVGFTTFFTYPDAMDEWNVVVWDWV